MINIISFFFSKNRIPENAAERRRKSGWIYRVRRQLLEKAVFADITPSLKASAITDEYEKFTDSIWELYEEGADEERKDED